MIKEKDRTILNLLRKNSRIQLTEIQKETSISVSTIFDRIKKLEQKKIIKKYTILLNTTYLRCSIKNIFVIKGEINNRCINTVEKLHKPEEKIVSAYFKTIQEYKQFKRKNKILKEFQIYETLFEENATI